MQNLLILVSLIFITLTAYGQASEADELKTSNSAKFSKFLGGNLIIRSSVREDVSQIQLSQSTIIRVQPYFGLDINERFSIGGLLDYRLSNRKLTVSNITTNSQESTAQAIGAGLFTRIYLKNGKLRFFIQNQVSYYAQFTKTNTTFPGREPTNTKSFLLSARVSPSFSYQLNRIRLLANFGGLNYLINGEEVDRDTNEVIDRSYSEWSIDIRPRFLSLGAEFIF